MKKCSICDIEKELSEFYRKTKEVDGRQRKCKDCAKEYDRQYYHRCSTRRKKAAWKNTKSRLRNQKYVYEYLSAHPCVDCGNDDPVVLEFDHVRGNKKPKLHF